MTAAGHEPTEARLRYGADRTDRRADAAMQRFRSHHLGQFIHFGLYALPAGHWAGDSYDFAAEFLPKSAGIAPAEWSRLADRFRLENFDADTWAAAAERMGARYVTITSKHHEGFCLWPTGYTRFHVGNTPTATTCSASSSARTSSAVSRCTSTIPCWTGTIRTGDTESWTTTMRSRSVAISTTPRRN